MKTLLKLHFHQFYSSLADFHAHFPFYLNYLNPDYYHSFFHLFQSKTNNKGKYIGQLINGKREGRGIIKWDNGDIYNGEWKEDKIEKDYDVDRVVEKVKKEIVKGAGYRNVTQVRNFR